MILQTGPEACPVPLTSTGDLFVSLVAAVVVEFGVGVVQDGPALRVLHGIRVALVVNVAAPAGEAKEPNEDNFKEGASAPWCRF